MKKRLAKWLPIVVVLAIVLGAGYWWLQPVSQRHMSPQAISVTEQALAAQPLPLTVSSIGTVIAPKTVMLKAQVSGQVDKLYFKPGQAVKGGQLLLSINAHSAQAQLSEQKAALWKAQLDLKRYQELAQKAPGAVSRDQLDQYKSTVQADQAKVAFAEQQLQFTQVKAPFDGVVSAQMPVRGATTASGTSLDLMTLIAPGAYVNAGDSLVELVDQKHLYVQYTLPQAWATKAKLGQKVEVALQSADGQPHQLTGVVTYLAPSVNTTTRVFTVHAKLDKPDGLTIKPGVFVHVQQVVDPNRQVLTVPALAIVPSMEGFNVYQVGPDNKVLQKPVKLGERNQDQVEILSGLKAGDKFILDGVNKVHVGSLVKVVSGS